MGVKLGIFLRNKTGLKCFRASAAEYFRWWK